MAITNKEKILRAVGERLYKYLNIVPTRNPGVPPAVTDMPYIAVYELQDMVTKTSGTSTGEVTQTRELGLLVEYYFKGESEDNLSFDFGDSYPKVRLALLYDPPEVEFKSSLDGLCIGIEELFATKVFRPVTGEPVAGIGLTFKIIYKESIKP